MNLNLNCVYSRNNLPDIKDGVYVISLDEFKSIATHWIALYMNGKNTFQTNIFQKKLKN